MELTLKKLKLLTTPQKKALYKKARRLYYNDTPIMSDASFDLLEDDLKAVAPTWPELKRTGAPVAKNIKKKVKLPIPMFSLDKAKPHNVDSRLAKWATQSGNAVISLKADGSSLELIYEDGVPTRAITRGDGRIGGDVSYLIPHMKIPQKVGTASFIVRCEAIFTAKAFSKYAEVFDQARNAASGILNRQDVHESLKDLSIVVLQLLKPNPVLSKGLAWAKARGFTVIPYKVIPLSALSSSRLEKILANQKAKAKFQIDGLVVALDRSNPLPTSGNPDWAFAFKVSSESKVTKVKKVHWDVSHLGTLIPRIEYDPVDWEGASLKFATAFNAKYIVDNHVGPGTQVEIVRSGDVIPYIEKVVINTARKPSLPGTEFGSYHWDKNKTHLLLDNPTENTDFRIRRLTKFFTAMDIDFVREQTVRKLYDLGFTNLTKILKAPPSSFVGEGTSPQGAQRLWSAIHKVLDSKVPLTKLMVASTTFPRGIGQRRLLSLGTQIDLLELASMPREKQLEIITSTDGWNTVMAKVFMEGVPKFLKWLDLVRVPYTNDTGVRRVKKVDGPLTDVLVSWTGYRSKEEELQVTKAGGTVVPFGSKTTVLLYTEGGKASSKVSKAQAKGITIMTWSQFAKRYKL